MQRAEKGCCAALGGTWDTLLWGNPAMQVLRVFPESQCGTLWGEGKPARERSS